MVDLPISFGIGKCRLATLLQGRRLGKVYYYYWEGRRPHSRLLEKWKFLGHPEQQTRNLNSLFKKKSVT